ncbi:MAG: Ig domain-containing protein, partial [Terracidiphilus sp.]
MRNTHKYMILGAALLLAGCSAITAPNGGPTPPIALTVLTITTTSLSNGTAGSSYSSSITASGGTTPYTYSASGLPSGMSIGSSTGAITGTPAQGSVGTASVAVTVLDSTQPTKQSATAKLSLTIQASKLVITTASLANATAGSSYSASITASGGTTPYTFKATGLPSGLSIGSSTGAITGTPAQSSVGTASVAITVTDSTQPTAQSTTATLSLTVV